MPFNNSHNTNGNTSNITAYNCLGRAEITQSQLSIYLASSALVGRVYRSSSCPSTGTQLMQNSY